MKPSERKTFRKVEIMKKYMKYKHINPECVVYNYEKLIFFTRTS